jgi:prepilin-type N-terminal cleavage/methylation domain-containing protein
MEQKQIKDTNNEKGFTLLEILVVLTIMGFLIAMVAPRLAGISGDAVDTVCDTNQNRMVTYMASYFEKTNRFPNNLTNIVEQTGGTLGTDATYQVPAVSDGDPDNGAETLAAEFNERNHFRIHYLDEDEAAEIKGLGVVSVYNLNAYDAYNNDNNGTLAEATDDYDATAAGANEVDLAASIADYAPAMEEVTVQEGLAVMMVGIGVDDSDAFVYPTEERGWGEPEFFGRIVLGMGAESGLIKDGVIGNAAHCPGGIQNDDNVTYNDYNLVLPRLESTVARMTDATIGAAITTTEIDCVGYTDEEPSATYAIATNSDNYKVRTFDIAEAQETWQFATMCPEGHMYPADDGDYWGMDLSDNDSLD